VETKVDIRFWEGLGRLSNNHEPKGSWLIILWGLRGWYQRAIIEIACDHVKTNLRQSQIADVALHVHQSVKLSLCAV
jgi:hypothetical protein